MTQHTHSRPVRSLPITIPVAAGTLSGDLEVPDTAEALVVFAHGSGSSRHSPRNKYVAGILHSHGIATLLMDLLTVSEEVIDDRTSALRFDIPLLGERVVQTLDWAVRDPMTSSLPVGCFGASTGAAAALVAAAKRPDVVRAVVSRGGRPDLAGEALGEVCAPTLLIVGGLDEPVIEMNSSALEQLRTTKALSIVPGATHLFEERGTLEQAAKLAAEWFERYLIARAETRQAA